MHVRLERIYQYLSLLRLHRPFLPFERLHIDIEPTETMSNLTVGKQQMCEIAKAISHEAKVIIFDEPSAALTASEIEELFKIIQDLRKQQLGYAIQSSHPVPFSPHSNVPP